MCEIATGVLAGAALIGSLFGSSKQKKAATQPPVIQQIAAPAVPEPLKIAEPVSQPMAETVVAPSFDAGEKDMPQAEKKKKKTEKGLGRESLRIDLALGTGGGSAGSGLVIPN